MLLWYLCCGQVVGACGRLVDWSHRVVEVEASVVEALFLLSPTQSVEMNEDYKHDDTFMNILREEGQILPFLDAIFGFLHRR